MSAVDRFREADRKAAEAAEAEEGGIESEIELYDSDRLALGNVERILSQKIGNNPSMTTEAWARECRERFEEEGFVVDVRLFTNRYEDHLPEEERTWYTKMVITGRCEPTKVGEFDHDRMGHEVRSNILGKKDQGNSQRVQVGQTGFSRTQSGLIVPGGE